MQDAVIDPHESAGAAPFVVAIGGHRDLHPDDIGAVGERLYEALQLVAASLPHTTLDCLSPLADGADQLFAAQVLRLRAAAERPERIRLLVPLPMPLAQYCAEQGGADGAAFAARIAPFLQAAACVFTIPQLELDATAGTAPSAANAPYARLVRYLALHAQLVIAVWDGQPTPLAPGGTLDLVNTRVHGFDRCHARRSAARLAPPQCGSVLHVHTRRARDGPAALAPAATVPLRALAPAGQGGDARACIRAAGAELDALNRQHHAMLAAGAGAYRARLAAARADLLASLAPAAAPDAALAALVSSFAVADVQAAHAKRRWRRCWVAIALAAVLAASSSLMRLLSDEFGDLIETLCYAGGAAAAVGTYLWVARSGRANAYLCYRALAEGLRVQLYWQAAGSAELVSDHYLIKQRDDAGWVRAALDALTLRQAGAPQPPARVARGWIDAQLAYLDGPHMLLRQRQQGRSTAWGRRLLAAGLVCALAGIVLVLQGAMRSAWLLVLIIIGMKLLTDVGAAWLSFNGKMAHQETLRQAGHLRAAYRRADRALRAAGEDGEDAADLLSALGKEVLDENANWLRLYLERRMSWHDK
ncbi:MAG: hypothetical protein QFF03_02145 [Pseudomonadota bacterium]|nr:hypothetical protein [Pseudomonadota bacterium]